MNPTRPSHILYGLDEHPPFLRLVFLGLQYTCMMFPYLIIVIILDRTQSIQNTNPLSLSLIALGICNLIQSIKNRYIGSGFLAPPVISAIYFPASMSALKMGGLPLVYGMTIFAGFFEILFSSFFHKVRKLFPPVVCGLIIMAVAFQLGILALSQTFAIDQWNSADYGKHLIASAFTLLPMIVLSVWGKGMWKLLSPFIGVLIGFAISCFLQITSSMESVYNAPWVSYPSLSGIEYKFSADLILPFVLASIASSLRVVGGVTTCQKMNHASWNGPDLKNIKKGVLGDGMGCLLGGLLGVPGINMAPSLIGVSRATGATSRSIAYALSAWLFVLAFLPKFIYLFLSIPLSVMGAALLYTASFMMAGGIDLITSRAMDTRAILIIGISILLGISQAVFPTYFSHLPVSIKLFTDSVLSVTTLSAVLLNLVFRIGGRQKVKIEQVEHKKQQLLEWIGEKSQGWGLSAATVKRIHESALSITAQLERGYIQQEGVSLNLVYDLVEVVLQFQYQGTMPTLRFDANQDRSLSEETPFIQGIENYSLEVYADKIKTSTKDTVCKIELYFHI